MRSRLLDKFGPVVGNCAGDSCSGSGELALLTRPTFGANLLANQGRDDSINPQFWCKARLYCCGPGPQQVIHPHYSQKLAMKIDSPERLRLGPLEVNIKTGEIRRANNPEGTKGAFLQEKSLRVLRMLMEKQGELVLREEIQKTLWPNDTVVDFDHGIHVAVATLRRALGDSATSPQFIETVPRRGYRLLVPIEEAGHDWSPEPAPGSA